MRKSRWPVAKSDADFAPYLAGGNRQATELFRRFVELARDLGPVTFELQRPAVVLCGNRRIFASVTTTQHGIGGIINLPRRVVDPRISRSEPLTKSLYLHRYAINRMSGLDPTFGGWLREAWLIGNEDG